MSSLELDNHVWETSENKTFDVAKGFKSVRNKFSCLVRGKVGGQKNICFRLVLQRRRSGAMDGAWLIGRPSI